MHYLPPLNTTQMVIHYYSQPLCLVIGQCTQYLTLIGRDQIQLDTSYLLLAPEIDLKRNYLFSLLMELFLGSCIILTFTGLSAWLAVSSPMKAALTLRP